MTCGRCGKDIAPDEDEACWFCAGLLCFDCWNELGHCGHDKADAINEATRGYYCVWEETKSKPNADAEYWRIMKERGY
jgi:hypothetical protein